MDKEVYGFRLSGQSTREIDVPAVRIGGQGGDFQDCWSIEGSKLGARGGPGRVQLTSDPGKRESEMF